MRRTPRHGWEQFLFCAYQSKSIQELSGILPPIDISRSKSDWQQIAVISGQTTRRLLPQFAQGRGVAYRSNGQQIGEIPCRNCPHAETMPLSLIFILYIQSSRRVILIGEISFCE